VLIMGLFGIAVFVMLLIVVRIAPQSTPPTPPAMNAPILEVVRWCETHARESKTKIVMVPVMIGKIATLQSRPQVSYVDSPDKFISCMQGYEYQVKR
jgi:hypothetical protein